MKIKEKRLTGIAILFTMILVTVAGVYLIYRIWDYRSADQAYEDMETGSVKKVKMTEQPDRRNEKFMQEKKHERKGIEGQDDSDARKNADEDKSHSIDEKSAETVDGLAIPDRPVIDWNRLKKSGRDIVAWIDIPALGIAYPVVQGDDNEFYLHHLPNGEYKNAGSLFMEAANSPDLTDINTVIYGHNMDNGSMFGRFRNMTEEDYRQQPFLWLCTKEKTCLYAMISLHISHVDDESYSLFNLAGSTDSLLSERDGSADSQSAVRGGDSDSQLIEEAADMSLTGGVGNDVYRWIRNENRRSYINMAIPESALGRIVTRSTCASYSDERRVLQAILVRVYAP